MPIATALYAVIVSKVYNVKYFSCFSHLSSLIATRELDEDQYDRISDNFPDFLWLIRDALELPLSEGKKLSPTEYLKKRVLVRSNSRQSTDRDEVVSAILRLFPSVECRTLPRPSADPHVVTNMEQRHDALEPAFKEELTKLVCFIRCKCKVKKFFGMQCNNGTIWAEFVTKHVDLVNSDNDLMLDNMYITAAESALSNLSQRFITEYKKEMEEALHGRLPMEEHSQDDAGIEETLLSIHNRIVGPKLEKFKKEIEHFLPMASDGSNLSLVRKKEELMHAFASEICQLSDSTGGRVVAGILHRFAVENHRASREFCLKIELEVFRGVRQMLQDAATKQSKVNISQELLAAEEKYYERAIGPAKDEVCKQVRVRLENDSSDLIRTVPGKPSNLQSTGSDKDKIKLRWVETNPYPGVVDFYQVQTMSGTENWTILPDHFTEQSAVIHNLKSNRKYLFQVRGVGKTGILGNWSDTYTCNTTLGSVPRGMATFGTFLGGMVVAPIAGLVCAPIMGPLSIVGGVVGGPILAATLAKKVAKRFGPKGELFTNGNAVDESTPLLDGEHSHSLPVAYTGNSNITPQAANDASLCVSETETYCSRVYEHDD